MSNILYIINPAGHGGAGIKVWERVQSEWPDEIDSEDVCFTERQGHAREIAASAEGYDVLTAVGGDGTVGEIMSGIMAQQPPHPRLAIILCPEAPTPTALSLTGQQFGAAGVTG